MTKQRSNPSWLVEVLWNAVWYKERCGHSSERSKCGSFLCGLAVYIGLSGTIVDFSKSHHNQSVYARRLLRLLYKAEVPFKIENCKPCTETIPYLGHLMQYSRLGNAQPTRNSAHSCVPFTFIDICNQAPSVSQFSPTKI